MKNNHLFFEVIKWEFSRWFKIKEQIISISLGIVLSFIIFGGKSLFDKNENKEATIALLNSPKISFVLQKDTKIKLLEKDTSELENQKKLLADEKIDGIVLIESYEKIKVYLREKEQWVDEIHQSISESFRNKKLIEHNLSEADLKKIFLQTELEEVFTGQQKKKFELADVIAAGVFLGIMLVGVFVGLAYQFVVITGEKQLRITEVLVSAIKPQTWIDGKIAGISLLSFVSIVNYSISGVFFVFISQLFGEGLALPNLLVNPAGIITMLLFSLAGLLLWNTFYSAIAATISDPNTSARSSLMLLPLLPVTIAFFALKNPEAIIVKILSWFPFTSFAVMPIRIALTHVSVLEIIGSLLLMCISIYYMRKAAGRIFALSILLYGKEPSWKEMARWLKEAKN
ncbi:MAG: hypothetical protein FD143_2219 [Ignavibacteria bacterium]|nr:MAG: hypothetical protein FD143_2219 [Ignavibacteria bacterium]KAF0158560.1 MAG: hypothetical protein FD188_2501 [Ignavibacteria bacterium]